MTPKPNARNWNDVQTAIATVAIVTTLGMWELFAAPAKTEMTQAQEPILPPGEPPADPVAAAPAGMPQLKIMFTQVAPQTNTAQQPQTVRKKKKKNNNGGSGSVTQTRSS